MYITNFHLENFCRLREVEVNIPCDCQRGWHVIIGDNASGKSSILKGVAIALINQPNFPALQINTNNFIHNNKQEAMVMVKTSPDEEHDELSSKKKNETGLFGAFFHKPLALSFFAFAGQLKSDCEDISGSFNVTPGFEQDKKD